MTAEDIECLNSIDKSDPFLRDMVLDKISKYIESFEDDASALVGIIRPFEFDSGNAYSNFVPFCKNYYKKTFQGNNLPNVLDFTLQYIGEISEHHSVFVHFYDIHSKQVANEILNKITAASIATVIQQRTI